MTDFLKLAKEAFSASTEYIDANHRQDWDYSQKAFRSEHASDSKYSSQEYRGRSKIFHPKTRSVIRKNEAAAAMALFSNMEVADFTPGNPDDVMNVASTACMKEIIQHRLTKTIPAFPLVMGAVQDAQTQGAVVSYNYWDYQIKPDGTKVKDEPCIMLRPLENIRFDPGADWLNPVESSPYWADILPMYVCDVRAMMNNKDQKTGKQKWKKFDDAQILKARPDAMDTTRQARLGRYQDPQQESTGIKEFDTVWVIRWCMRDSQGDDHTFYTLGTDALLCDAKPLGEVYFHNRRPYTMGWAILETHRTIKSSIPTLIKGPQQAINQIANSRFDNVQFVLNKRWLVARGRQVDIQSLVRNVPGGVTMVNNPNEDVKESTWADVTSSSYVEHDRFNAELDDLAGNFSPSTKVANNAVNDTLGGSRMANQSAGVMSDYLLRTIIETWWEPTLRHLVLLEQQYETDDIVLGVCAQKARLFPKFGISRITDQMLMNEVNVSVNVGMGASNPAERFQRFILAVKSATELVNTAPPGFNVAEGIKEIFSNAGYRDGARFFNENGGDPRLQKAMQAIQQLTQALKSKGMELQANGQMKQMELQSAERQKAAQLKVDQDRIHGDLALRNRELDIKAADAHNNAILKHAEITKPEPVEEPDPIDPDMRKVELADKMAGVDLKVAQAEKARSDAKVASDVAAAQNEKIGAETLAAQTAMLEKNDISEQLQKVAKAVEGLGLLEGRFNEMNKGLGALAGFVLQPKKKPKGFKFIKDGKTTKGITTIFDDGSEETLTAQ